MDSPFMNAFADLMTARGVGVVRFEFAYMAARRSGGTRRPPPKADRLIDEYVAAVRACSATGPLVIGGKSMGGRVASMIADDLFARTRIAGLVCLGYPFHPPRKQSVPRTAHLADLVCPTLIVQGEADPLGTRAEVEGYRLSPNIQLHWMAAADHDLVPKVGNGRRKADVRARAWAEAADAIEAFARGL
jgi:uncharacterized protein